MDHLPRCPCLCYVTWLHGRIVHVVHEFMVEAAAVKIRDLRMEVRRIRYGGSRAIAMGMLCGWIFVPRVSM
jgi:hypothetical protein